MSERQGAFAQVLVTALLFSTGGAVIKASELSSWQIASFRSAVAAVTLLWLLPEARRRWSRRTLMVAAAYAATLVLFVHANKLTTAANTIFLQATAPLWVLVLAPRLLGEPWRRQDLWLLAAFAGGLALCFLGAPAPAQTAPAPMAGNLLAALSGLTYALTLLGLRAAGRRSGVSTPESSPGAALACGNLLAFLFGLPWAFPVGPVAAIDLGAVLFLGVFQIGLAYVLLAGAIRHVTALETSLLLLLEPMLSPVWAGLVHGERPGELALVGGGVILGATAAKAWLEVSAPQREAAKDLRP